MPAPPSPGVTMGLEERFWSHVDREWAGGCWPWTGSLNPKGYGRFHLPRPMLAVQAHRFAYELAHGPIPEGLTLDHLCRTRRCVNPDHLEPVTNRENVLRGETLPAANLAKTECKRGHLFTPENTYTRPGTTERECRRCAATAVRERYWADPEPERARHRLAPQEASDATD